MKTYNKYNVYKINSLKYSWKQNYRYPSYKLHNELRILKVEDLVDQEILTFVFNFINNKNYKGKRSFIMKQTTYIIDQTHKL